MNTINPALAIVVLIVLTVLAALVSVNYWRQNGSRVAASRASQQQQHQWPRLKSNTDDHTHSRQRQQQSSPLELPDLRKEREKLWSNRFDVPRVHRTTTTNVDSDHTHQQAHRAKKKWGNSTRSHQDYNDHRRQKIKTLDTSTKINCWIFYLTAAVNRVHRVYSRIQNTKICTVKKSKLTHFLIVAVVDSTSHLHLAQDTQRVQSFTSSFSPTVPPFHPSIYPPIEHAHNPSTMNSQQQQRQQRQQRHNELNNFHPPRLRIRRGSLPIPIEDFECLNCRVSDSLEKEFRQFETGGVAQSPLKTTTAEMKRQIQRSIRRMSLDENTIVANSQLPSTPVTQQEHFEQQQPEPQQQLPNNNSSTNSQTSTIPAPDVDDDSVTSCLQRIDNKVSVGDADNGMMKNMAAATNGGAKRVVMMRPTNDLEVIQVLRPLDDLHNILGAPPSSDLMHQPKQCGINDWPAFDTSIPRSSLVVCCTCL